MRENVIFWDPHRNFYELQNISKNLTFDIQKKELRSNDRSGKLGFIISSYAKNCGYAALDKKHECNLFKPLISKNLIN